jgi:hypothetical protein
MLMDISRSGALLSPNIDLPESTEVDLRLAGGQSARVTVVRQSTVGTAVAFDGAAMESALVSDLVNLARIAGPCRPELS